MTAPVPRFRCPAVHANGDRCTRRDPHGPQDLHNRGPHTWGSRDVPA